MGADESMGVVLGTGLVGEGAFRTVGVGVRGSETDVSITVRTRPVVVTFL